MKLKQVKFKNNKNNKIYGGILLEDGSIICGESGDIINANIINEQYTIIDIYDSWINLTETILGDDGDV